MSGTGDGFMGFLIEVRLRSKPEKKFWACHLLMYFWPFENGRYPIDISIYIANGHPALTPNFPSPRSGMFLTLEIHHFGTSPVPTTGHFFDRYETLFTIIRFLTKSRL